LNTSVKERDREQRWRASEHALQGRLDDALKLREEALTRNRKVFGPQHPDTLRAISRLAVSHMTQEEKLMTSNARGRVLVPKERREALLEEFERSGLSGVKFAQLAGIKYPTFANLGVRPAEMLVKPSGMLVKPRQTLVEDPLRW